MANKGKTKGINKNLIFAILLAFFSIIYLSVLSDNFGFIGNLIGGVSFKLLGIGSYIIYPIIIINLLLAIVGKLDKLNIIRFILIYACILVFLIIVDINLNTPVILANKIKTNIDLAESHYGVGIIGSFLSYVTNFLIGKAGSYILFIILIFFTVLSLIKLSVRDFFIESGKMIKNFLIKFSSFIKNLLNKIKDNKKDKRTNKTEEKRLAKNKNNENKNTDLEDYTNNTLKISNYVDNSTDKQLSMDDYEIKLDHGSSYSFPPIELLSKRSSSNGKDNLDKIEENAELIEETLDSFNIKGKVVQVNRGPRVTSYELQPAGGVKVSSIVNLQDNLALSLATSGIRIEAPIPGKSVVGIEVPNKSEDSVGLKEILVSRDFVQNDFKIPFALGKDIAGNSLVTGIEKMPHLLIAGATGSGKSVCINTLIMSILFSKSPEEVKMILIDPKMVELSVYNEVPHLVIPVVTNPKKASAALNWAVKEMERRYEIFSEKSVRDIEGYKENYSAEDDENLPYIVIIIDELSDLMMVAANEVEDHISRLAQMARACGIHLVIATQRPSVDVITGTIKANIPSRISFSVSSQIDSRTILDMAGAEKLLGKGDMLFYPSNYMKPVRIQGAYVSDGEVENIVSYIKDHSKEEYDEEVIEDIKNQKIEKNSIDSQDELLSEAIDIVILEKQASVSLIQRRLHVGYARAGRIIDQMEALGVIEGHQGSKAREVLVDYNILEAGEDNQYS